MAAAVVALEGLRFRWRRGAPPCLEIASFSVDAGERVFLHGASGSGKSTLLSLIGGVLSPERGRIEVRGVELGALSQAARDRHRADHMGVIFQMFNLIPYLSALDNILLPLLISRHRRQRVANGAALEDEARRLLARLGLEPAVYAAKKPTQLSVGEQQRVAVARALIGRPEVIIADEPTSSLDRDRQIAFVTLLGEEVRAAGAALLLVSHDLSLTPHLDRVVALDNILAGSARRDPSPQHADA
jgi:putative ABC transport system ATP-binding protein